MSKDVIISVNGLHNDEMDQPIEIISKGRLYRRKGKTYVRYEQIDSYNNVSKCMVVYDDSSVEISRSDDEGSMHLLFEEGKNCLAAYDLPYGRMLVGTTTSKLDISESTDAIHIHIEYSLDVNYSYVSDSSVDIRINLI